MKHLVIVGFLAVLSILNGRLQAQLFAGIGLQAGFYSMPNANIPVDRYVDRGYLYKKMHHFHWPMGEIYEIGVRPDRAYLHLNLNTRRQRISAQSFDQNALIQRDVRFVIQTLSLGAGYDLADQETFACYLGGSVDAGYMRLLTRTGQKETINRTDYYLFRRTPMLATSFFLKMVFRSSRDAITVWSLTPYVQYPFQKFDFVALDQVLNLGYNTGNVPTTLPARPVNVGVALNFDIELIGFLTD